MATPTSETNILTPLTPTKPDLRILFNQLRSEILSGLFCAQTATIVSFNAAKQIATVSINMQMVIGYTQSASTGLTTTGGETVASQTVSGANPTSVPYTHLYEVPVLCLGGGGGAVTFPINAGDTCLLVFIDRDIDNWVVSGQTNLPPNTVRMHDISDAVAIVGLRSQVNPLDSYSTTDVQLYGGGTGQPMISLGSGRVGIKNDVTSLLTTFNVLIDTLTGINSNLILALNTLNVGGALTPEITALTTIQSTTIPALAADVLALLK